MAYCTLTDIEKKISEEEVVQLTDDDGEDAVNTDTVDAAITDADAEIDGYCGRRYPVPMDPVPPILRKFSVDIAIYNLYQRRQGAPDDREKDYKNAIRFLENIAKGLVSLGSTDPDGVPAATNKPTIVSATKIFSRDKMAGW
jgi:phage gp36-like protein